MAYFVVRVCCHVCYRRSAAARLGGFWDQWTDIPVDILHQVCGLVADRPYPFADYLGVSNIDILGKRKAETPVELTRQIMEIWVAREGTEATLEVLFVALERMKLLRALEASVKKSMGNGVE